MGYITSNKNLTVAIILLVVFIAFTVAVKTVDVAPAGETMTEVGFSGINDAIFNAAGVNDTWATITKLMGLAAIAVAGGLALIGIVQIIKGKSFDAVDSDIYALALTFVLLGIFYVLFEVVVINYRPILEDGELAASYPSSHTLLVIAIFGMALTQLELRAPDGAIKTIISFVTIAVMVVMPIGRILAGVHWFTDVIAAIILGLGLVYFYNGILDLIYDFNITSSSILDALHIGFFRNSINELFEDDVYEPDDDEEENDYRDYDYDEDEEEEDELPPAKPSIKSLFGGKKKSSFESDFDEDDFDDDEEELKEPKPPKFPVKLPFMGKKKPAPVEEDDYYDDEEYDEYEEDNVFDDDDDEEEEEEVKEYIPKKEKKAPVKVKLSDEEPVAKAAPEFMEALSEVPSVKAPVYPSAYNREEDDYLAKPVDESRYAPARREVDPEDIYDIHHPDFFSFVPNEKPSYDMEEETEERPRPKKKEKLYIDGEYVGRH